MTYHKLYDSSIYDLDGWKMNAKGIYDGVPYLIYSNAFPACYVGIHKDCKAYDLIGRVDIGEINLRKCQNEVTWVDYGDGKHRPDDFLWIGWDYGHVGQYSAYMGQPSEGEWTSEDHVYTIEELIEDIKNAVYDVKHNLIYAMVNGELKFMVHNGFRSQNLLPSDCVIEYVSPMFNFSTYDPDIIREFEKVE